MRGKSGTRQPVNDAWDATNWMACAARHGTWWLLRWNRQRKSHLTKKELHPLPRIVVERIPEVELRRFYVLSADIEAHDHTGGCPGCAALASHGRATKPHNNECRERTRTSIERTLTGKARMNAYEDRVAETERVKEKELDWKEVQEMCLWNPGTRSRWRIDMRSHVARTRQNDENRMRRPHW